jgi:hypothetical protein
MSRHVTPFRAARTDPKLSRPRLLVTVVLGVWQAARGLC